MPKHKCAATMAPTIAHQTRDLSELAEAFHTPPKAQEGLSQRRPRREACAAQDHRGDQDDAGRRRWAPPHRHRGRINSLILLQLGCNMEKFHVCWMAATRACADGGNDRELSLPQQQSGRAIGACGVGASSCTSGYVRTFLCWAVDDA